MGWQGGPRLGCCLPWVVVVLVGGAGSCPARPCSERPGRIGQHDTSMPTTIITTIRPYRPALQYRHQHTVSAEDTLTTHRLLSSCFPPLVPTSSKSNKLLNYPLPPDYCRLLLLPGQIIPFDHQTTCRDLYQTANTTRGRALQGVSNGLWRSGGSPPGRKQGLTPPSRRFRPLHLSISHTSSLRSNLYLDCTKLHVCRKERGSG